jgi:hypothetical protein
LYNFDVVGKLLRIVRLHPEPEPKPEPKLEPESKLFKVGTGTKALLVSKFLLSRLIICVKKRNSQSFRVWRLFLLSGLRKITNRSKNQSSDTDSGSDHKMGDKKMEEKKAFSTQLAMKIKVRGVSTVQAVALSSLLARARSLLLNYF